MCSPQPAEVQRAAARIEQHPQAPGGILRAVLGRIILVGSLPAHGRTLLKRSMRVLRHVVKTGMSLFTWFKLLIKKEVGYFGEVTGLGWG